MVASLMPMLVVGGRANGQDDNDPHRPACTSVRCQKIRSFVKTHYCGAPQGNGPEDSCEIRRPTKLGDGVKVIANFDCKWIEGVRKCQQKGEPSSDVQNLLMNELHRLGLPSKAPGQIYFTDWESIKSSWSLVSADYERRVGDSVYLCQIIAIADQSLHLQILRKVKYQKTDADVPTVTTWSPLDLADADGDGKIDVILEGDAYEDHWFEVDSVSDGASRTIFSGLGYYL
jgi:hypothetical protein